MKIDVSGCDAAVANAFSSTNRMWNRARGASRCAGFLLLCLIVLHPVAASAFGDDGFLRFGFRTDAAPFSYCAKESECAGSQTCAVKSDSCGKDGWIEGYSVRLCEEVAAHLRKNYGNSSRLKRIDYVPVTTQGENERFKLLENGKIHLLCGASTITLQRMQMNRISLYTFLSGASVVYRKDAPVIDATDLVGRRVGVLKNTTTEALVTSILKTAGISKKPFELQSHRDAPVALLADSKSSPAMQLDTYFGDREILLWMLKRNDMAKTHEVSSKYFSLEPYALFINDGSKNLQNEVNTVLAGLFSANRPRLDYIFKRSFGTPEMSDLIETMFRIQQINLGQEKPE